MRVELLYMLSSHTITDIIDHIGDKQVGCHKNSVFHKNTRHKTDQVDAVDILHQIFHL